MKKFISFVLVTALATSGIFCASPLGEVYGAENDSKGMEKAILVVKNVVKIPDSYTDFNYSYYDSKEQIEKKAGWNFNWSDKDGSKGSISAFVDNDYTLTSYENHVFNERQGVGKLTYDKGEKIASEFLKKANPTYGKEMKVADNPGNSNGEAHNYKFSLYKNDVPVDFISADLSVDKYTNEVVRYSFTDSITNGDYPDVNGIVSKSEAEKIYISNGGISLKYFSNFDYKTEKITVFPAYHVPNITKFVDAKTGEIVTSTLDDSLNRKAEAAMDAGGRGTLNSNLTPGELEALGKVNNLMSKGQAQEKASAYMKSLNYALSPNSSSLSQNNMEKNKFYWEFSFDNGYISIDAVTGELIRFNIYNETTQKGATVTEEKAKISGENFAKSVVKGDKWSQVKLIPTEDKISFKIGYESETYNFNYARQANGITFDSNSIDVSVNRYTGKVTGYSCNWYDEVVFPSIEKAISPEKAFVIMNSTGNFQLIYLNSDKIIKLGYNFTEDIRFYVDVFAGKKLSFDGKLYTETSVPEYKDLAGHFAAPTVNTLKENGYFLPGNEFKPNQKITQESFLRYLYSPNQSNYDSQEFYAMLERNGIIKAEEKSPQKELKRQDGAKFTVRYLGLDKAATLTNLYKNMFNDKVDAQYIGYAALANGLKIMSGDKNGNFTGTKSMTNAEAALIIYRTLEVK